MEDAMRYWVSILSNADFCRSEFP